MSKECKDLLKLIKLGVITINSILDTDLKAEVEAELNKTT